MDITLFVLMAVAVLITLYGIDIYNRRGLLRQNTAQAWPNIDAFISQRREDGLELQPTSSINRFGQC